MESLGAMGPSAVFQQALNEGRLVLQKSGSTGQYLYPPRVAAPGLGVEDLEWQEASGLGSIYALTVISRRPERGGDYAICLVELDEGPRIMSRIVSVDPEVLYIGMRVQAHIDVPDFGTLKGGNQSAVLFQPLADGATL